MGGVASVLGYPARAHPGQARVERPALRAVVAGADSREHNEPIAVAKRPGRS
jgi:hypothetical protein